jgi:hypothetical protein
VVVQEGGGVAVAQDPLDAVADLQALRLRLQGHVAVLRGEVDEGHARPVDGFRPSAFAVGHRLEARVHDPALRDGPAGDRGDDGERVLELIVHVAFLAVEPVEEAAAACLELRHALDEAGGHVRAGPAAADDLDRDPVLLDEADRVDHAGHGLAALALLLLERPDREQVALVAHHALEDDALRLQIGRAHV